MRSKERIRVVILSTIIVMMAAVGSIRVQAAGGNEMSVISSSAEISSEEPEIASQTNTGTNAGTSIYVYKEEPAGGESGTSGNTNGNTGGKGDVLRTKIVNTGDVDEKVFLRIINAMAIMAAIAAFIIEGREIEKEK